MKIICYKRAQDSINIINCDSISSIEFYGDAITIYYNRNKSQTISEASGRSVEELKKLYQEIFDFLINDEETYKIITAQ